MTEYVVGFLFDPDFEEVVLIRKEKPAWQKGMLNGVGGKIEEGETPDEAMRREFHEETGLVIGMWNQYATLEGAEFKLYLFSASTAWLHTVRSVTEEQVAIYKIENLPQLNTIPNLQWLIPMSISMHRGERATYFDVRER